MRQTTDTCSASSQSGRPTTTAPGNAEPVLLLTGKLWQGGTERQLVEVARALDRARFTPHVGCNDAEGFRAEELKRIGVPILEFAMPSLFSKECAAAVGTLRAYARANRIRIFHAYDSAMNAFAVPAARLLRIPVVLSSQRCFEDVVYPPHRKLVRLAHRISHGVVVNCEAVRSDVERNYGVPRSRIHLCYNGLDTTKFHSHGRSRPDQLRDARLVIGAVCALRPEKDLDTLLKAFAKVSGHVTGLRLVIVGSGPQSETLGRLAGELGIAENCLFIPSTPDVDIWLRAIDIFVLPSLSEAFSNSLMEAMASGCAAIASSVGGNPELVKHEETGLLFQPADVDSLASQLSRMLASDDLRNRMARQGSERIRSNFSLEGSVQRMQEIYAMALAGARKS